MWPPAAPSISASSGWPSRGIIGGYPCGGAGRTVRRPGQPALLPPEQQRHARPDGEDRRLGLLPQLPDAGRRPPRRRAPPTRTPHPAPTATPSGACPMFPADNIWNRNIAALPTHVALRQLHQQHRHRLDPARRLRLRALARRPHRHPLYHRARQPAARADQLHLSPTRATPAPTRSRPTRRSRAGRTAAATATCWWSTRALARCMRCIKSYPQRDGSWQRRVGRRLAAELERAAPRRLDLGGRRGAAHPARPGAL